MKAINYVFYGVFGGVLISLSVAALDLKNPCIDDMLGPYRGPNVLYSCKGEDGQYYSGYCCEDDFSHCQFQDGHCKLPYEPE
jgi:hypothetical protein